MNCRPRCETSNCTLLQITQEKVLGLGPGNGFRYNPKDLVHERKNPLLDHMLVKTLWQEREQKSIDWKYIFTKNIAAKGLLPKICEKCLKYNNNNNNKNNNNLLKSGQNIELLTIYTYGVCIH